MYPLYNIFKKPLLFSHKVYELNHCVQYQAYIKRIPSFQMTETRTFVVKVITPLLTDPCLLSVTLVSKHCLLIRYVSYKSCYNAWFQ